MDLGRGRRALGEPDLAPVPVTREDTGTDLPPLGRTPASPRAHVPSVEAIRITMPGYGIRVVTGLF